MLICFLDLVPTYLGRLELFLRYFSCCFASTDVPVLLLFAYLRVNLRHSDFLVAAKFSVLLFSDRNVSIFLRCCFFLSCSHLMLRELRCLMTFLFLLLLCERAATSPML